jgi:hypothetical protein
MQKATRSRNRTMQPTHDHVQRKCLPKNSRVHVAGGANFPGFSPNPSISKKGIGDGASEMWKAAGLVKP